MPVTNDGLEFFRYLKEIIPPKNSSDRTTFLKITCWIEANIRKGVFKKNHFTYILDCARDSAIPESRNKAAVFVSILQKELGYGKSKSNRRNPHK